METTAQRAQPPVARRLTRTTDEKMIAGVAAGLGRYFGVDPVIFRIGFVLAAFAGGVGVFAYLLAWLVIPEAGENTSEAERILRSVDQYRTRNWFGIGLLVLGVSLLVGQVGWWDPGVIWGFALIAVGVILFRQDASRTQPGEEPPPPPPPRPATAVKATSEAPAVRARRERSALGWLAAGAAFIAVGLAAVLADLDVITLEVGQYFGTALAVLGAGLVVGAWWGRARLLIIVGLLLLPAALASSAVRVPIEGGVGERFFTPRSAAEVRDEYRLAAGEMSLDFTEMDFSGGSIDTEASVVAGRLEVIVPDDVTVDVSGHVGLGQISMFGRQQNGTEVDMDRVVQGSAAEWDLNLDLETSFGEIIVVHAPFSN